MSKQHEKTIPRCMQHATGHRHGEPGKVAETHQIPEKTSISGQGAVTAHTLLKCILYLVSALFSLFDAMDPLELMQSLSRSCCDPLRTKVSDTPQNRSDDHNFSHIETLARHYARPHENDAWSAKALFGIPSGRRPDDDLDVQRVGERISQSLGMFSSIFNVSVRGHVGGGGQCGGISGQRMDDTDTYSWRPTWGSRTGPNAGLRKLRSYLLILRNLSVIRCRQTCFRIEKYVVIWFTSVHANILAWAAWHYAIKVSKARVTSNAIFSLNHRIGSLPVREGLQMYMARVDCYRQLTLDTDISLLKEHVEAHHMFLRRLLGLNPHSVLAVLFTETSQFQMPGQ
ncbi:hypothetical protein B0H11DRAFT_1900795 [Mycena galericulata]|nr:hypothetical protein B0H11DRAFT_1900795 [Mycena galericulata]